MTIKQSDAKIIKPLKFMQNEFYFNVFLDNLFDIYEDVIMCNLIINCYYLLIPFVYFRNKLQKKQFRKCII